MPAGKGEAAVWHGHKFLVEIGGGHFNGALLVLIATVVACLGRYTVSVGPSTSNNFILIQPSSVFFIKGKHNVQAHCKTEILV